MRRGGCERDCGEILLHRLLLLEKTLLVTSAPVCIPLISDSSQCGWNRGNRTLSRWCTKMSLLNLYWFYQWIVDLISVLKLHYMPFCLNCLSKAKLCSHSLEMKSLLWCLGVAQWKNNNNKKKIPLCVLGFSCQPDPDVFLRGKPNECRVNQNGHKEEQIQVSG